MKRQKRDRHTAKGDRDDRFAQMTSRDPGEKAREWMRRPAYAGRPTPLGSYPSRQGA